MYASDVKHSRQGLHNKLKALYALNREKTIDLSFRAPFLDLLKALGNPHQHLPPIIHVAGTNGKGSVVAMLRSILTQAGYRVHTYTSPHLRAFNERIVLAGEMIKDDTLEDLIDHALALNKNTPVTFFEITTAMAFYAFSQVPADICLIEVGMGGRLDCTNVIENPLVSIINAIGLDHQEYLGETMDLIAAEKAGIIKDGASVVIGAQTPEAIKAGVMKVFKSIAMDKKALLYICDEHWIAETFDAQHMRFVFQGQEMILPLSALPGIHQINNAGAALAVLKIIEKKFPTSQSILEKGLKEVSWPGRLQKLQTGFLNTIIGQHWQLYLDGAHNEHAAKALAQWCDTQNKPIHLILGMMNHKDPLAFIEILKPYVHSIRFTAIPEEPKAFLPHDIKGKFPQYACFEKLEEALDDIIQNQEPGIILIAGSLYLVGHVLHLQARAS